MTIARRHGIGLSVSRSRARAAGVRGQYGPIYCNVGRETRSVRYTFTAALYEDACTPARSSWTVEHTPDDAMYALYSLIDTTHRYYVIPVLSVYDPPSGNILQQRGFFTVRCTILESKWLVPSATTFWRQVSWRSYVKLGTFANLIVLGSAALGEFLAAMLLLMPALLNQGGGGACPPPAAALGKVVRWM